MYMYLNFDLFVYKMSCTLFFIRGFLSEHEPEIWWKVKNKAEPEALS